ncbi:uncharacterized protein LOC124191092 isoform X3 [Daphnia pulex]|uniref:uncharacterized protein LOC124191092 isoform X3 n=1 Tax=Daphnia pulex TaxID=6669 RepID=UPI001EDF6458|nr:uncharacterized protein LOC124191092 isoform X3 [Daphnia pulex]
MAAPFKCSSGRANEKYGREKMWNLTTRPRAGDPHCWTNRSTSIGAYKEIDNSLIMMPDKLNEDAHISILRARAVIPSMNISSAPKPPKKRFLEAAAAHQLEEQQRLEQEQQELKSRASGEDNSALMQLAEMCVYYQASNTSHPSGSWSPVGGAWNCIDHRVVAVEQPVEPTMYSISMSSTVQSEASPKAAPFWGWANRSLLQSEQDLENREEEEENEEPLDLSGEETIRTNQQELIDHLVEKLCARPVSGKFSSLVQKKLSLLEPPPSSEAASIQNSSSEVSSSIDLKDSVMVAAKDVRRRDLPLKKRDPSSLHQSYDQRGEFCDSSTATKPLEPSSVEAVTSTNSSRITLSSRGLRRSESNEQQAEEQAAPCDQSSIGSKNNNNKRQRQVRQAEPGSGKAALSLRGRNAKLRKLS